MKELDIITDILRNEEISYNPMTKKKFKKSGLIFLKQLGEDLKLSETVVSFNPGGIAVSGDLILMGMCNVMMGVYVTISQGGYSPLMYRTIKDMKDYAGGRNHFIELDKLNDYDSILDKIKQIVVNDIISTVAQGN